MHKLKSNLLMYFSCSTKSLISILHNTFLPWVGPLAVAVDPLNYTINLCWKLLCEIFSFKFSPSSAADNANRQHITNMPVKDNIMVSVAYTFNSARFFGIFSNFTSHLVNLQTNLNFFFTQNWNRSIDWTLLNFQNSFELSTRWPPQNLHECVVLALDLNWIW